MTSRSHYFASIFFVVIIIVGVFGVGFYIGSVNGPASAAVITVENKEEGKVTTVDFEPFWKAWSILDDRFVGSTTPEDQAKVWGAIQGLAESYGDPYTVFFPPVEKKEFEAEISGNFEGVGMEIGIRDGALVVVSPITGTPAFRAGVKPGDKILKIDGEDSITLNVEQAVKKIRGPRGTKVSLTLGRAGVSEPIEVTIVRDVIDLPTIETELTPEGVFVIRLYNFSALSFGKFRDALREFVVKGNDKLIIDLRNNPGGYLEAAVDMASWFLPVGKVVVREDYGNNASENVHRSHGYDIFSGNLKLVVLVNGGSASASEILAGALKDHGKAVLVGEKTFGKGSVQELVNITNETSLKITIARWLTPNGTSISGQGITPEYVVPITQEDVEKGEDPQLRKAIDILTGRR